VFVSVALAVALAGCGSSGQERVADDARIKRELLRGVDRIRTVGDRHELNRELALIVADLRRLRDSTVSAGQARELAVEGFGLTIKGTRYQLDFAEHDSGEVAAATKDAVLADRFLTRGANHLRAAGRLFGIRIGLLNQH
jgi:hypothetical protein